MKEAKRNKNKPAIQDNPLPAPSIVTVKKKCTNCLEKRLVKEIHETVSFESCVKKTVKLTAGNLTAQ